MVFGGASTAHAATATLNLVHLSTNGTASASWAKTGDIVTIHFTSTVGDGDGIGSVSVAFTSGGAGVAGAVAIASTSQTDWTATYTANAADTAGPVAFAVNFKDHGSQASGTQVVATTDASTATFDKTAPTVTVNQKSSQTDPINTLPLLFNVVFSERVASVSFTTADITQNGTATGVTWTLTASGSAGTTFVLRATVVTGDGTLVPSIAVNKTTDMAGNNNAASTATDNSVTYDSATPALTNLAATTSNTTAALTWTSSEAASSWVDYGTNASYGTTTSEADTSTRVTSHTVNLSSLGACTQYYYRTHSKDAASNEGVSYLSTFLTTGCAASQHPSGYSSTATSATPTPTPAQSATPTPMPAPDATSTPMPSVHQNGSLIRYADDPKVYVIDNGMKRWIQTAVDFVGLGYSWNGIITIPANETYPDGVVMLQSRGQIISQFVHFLSRGSKGDEVRTLQEKLKALGFFPADIKVTGFYGLTTVASVKAFQKARGISPVGYVGPATRAQLNR